MAQMVGVKIISQSNERFTLHLPKSAKFVDILHRLLPPESVNKYLLKKAKGNALLPLDASLNEENILENDELLLVEKDRAKAMTDESDLEAKPSTSPPIPPEQMQRNEALLIEMRAAMQAGEMQLAKKQEQISRQKESAFLWQKIRWVIIFISFMLGLALVLLQQLPLGVLSALISIVPEAGMHLRLKSLNSDEQRIENLREQRTRRIEDINFALMIDDPEKRNAAIMEIIQQK